MSCAAEGEQTFLCMCAKAKIEAPCLLPVLNVPGCVPVSGLRVSMWASRLGTTSVFCASVLIVVVCFKLVMLSPRCSEEVFEVLTTVKKLGLTSMSLLTGTSYIRVDI